jgi:hypothetical protein
MRTNQYVGALFTLDVVILAPVDHTREHVLHALRAHYAEHQRPASIKTLAKMTHRRTRTVIGAVQEPAAAGLAQRLGRQGKQSVMPLLDGQVERR